MRIFRNYDYPIRKPDTSAAALRRCIDVLRRHGLGEARISHQFEDMSFSNTSAVDRIRKRFPTLGDGDSNRVSSEAADMLCEIFEGIARKYPLATAQVMIHEIPWSNIANFPDAAPAVMETQLSLGALTIGNHWWISGRNQLMRASIEVEGTGKHDATELPSEITSLLRELGKPKKVEIEVHLGDREQASMDTRDARARTVMDRYLGAIAEIAATLSFPHQLPDPVARGLRFPEEKIGSYKPALNEVFGPIGYVYQSSRSGQGTFVLSKPSPAGFELELSLDVGSHSRKASGLLLVKGDGWFACATLVMNNWENQFAWYPIVDAATWRNILENIRACVEYYEQTFVPEIEQIYTETVNAGRLP